MTRKVKGSPFALLKHCVEALLVLLFMYTGFSKLFALEDFTGTLYNQPIPHVFVPLLTWIFPCLEVLTAGCLLFGRTRRIGLYSSLALMILFTAYIGAILLHFFHKTPCSCGGIFRTLTWPQHFAINLGLIMLTCLALFQGRKPQGPPSKTISSPINSAT